MTLITETGNDKISSKKHLVVMILMAFLALMVMFIDIMLIPALPDIYPAFPQYAKWTSWILAIYLLSGAIANPIIGKLGDIYGKKKMLMITLCIYTVGLFGCALSYKSFEGLILFRAIQGVGLAMFPLFFGIIRDTFPKDMVPMAIGIISAMFSVGVSIGLLGGGFISSTFGWEYCYYIVAPLILVFIPIVHFLIKDGGVTGQGRRVDILGAAVLSSCMLTLLVALTLMEGNIERGDAAINPLVIGCIAYFVISLLAFVFWEKRTDEPIIKLSLLRGPRSTAHVAAFFYGISMFMMFQTIPSLLTEPEAYGGFDISNTFHVGLVMFPIAVMGLIFGPFGGKLCRKPGSSVRVLAVGMALFGLGDLFLILLHSELWMIIVGMCISGAGNALAMVSMMNALVDTTPKEDFGVASGMNTTFRLIGGSIGPVLGMTILSTFAVSQMGGHSIYGIDGYIWTWVLGLVFCSLGALYAFHMKGKHLEGTIPID